MTTSVARLTVRDISLIGIFTALIAVMAQISIPLPGSVPMTLQTLAIPLAGIVLGPKKGTLATIVYLLLGALGAPVFAGFNGGFGVFLSFTGGFLLSFPLMALAAGYGAAATEQTNNRLWLWLGLFIGAVINFACGMFYFSWVAGSGLPAAFAATVAPFVLTALVKIVAAALLGEKLRALFTQALVR